MPFKWKIIHSDPGFSLSKIFLGVFKVIMFVDLGHYETMLAS